MNEKQDNKEQLNIRYRFKFGDGREKVFHAALDAKTLELIREKKESYPEWTSLNCSKCENCPLDEKISPRCPVAVNMTDIIEFFRNSASHDKVDVFIETDSRSYANATTIEEGVSSLIGIYMVTSGCPIMEKLKPMVKNHLPFATLEETRYRAVSMYLLAQYVVYKKGGKPDWDLKELLNIYNQVRIANRSFARRLSNAVENDANANALVKLDSFALNVSFVIDQDMMSEMEQLFEVYTRDLQPDRP